MVYLFLLAWVREIYKDKTKNLGRISRSQRISTTTVFCHKNQYVCIYYSRHISQNY